jgi:hypothetical protein
VETFCSNKLVLEKAKNLFPRLQLIRADGGYAVQGDSLCYEMEWKERTFQVRVDPLRNSARAIIGTVGILPDVTDRKQTLADLKSRERQQAAVAALGLRALTGLSGRALVDEAASVVCRTLGIEFCKVLDFVPEQRRFRWAGGFGWSGATPATLAEGESQAGYALLRGEAIIAHDVNQESRFQPSNLLKAHRVVSGIRTVIRSQAGLLGVLGAFTTQPRYFTQDDIHFLQAVANVLAASTERQQAEEARGRLVAILEATPDFVTICSADSSERTSRSARPWTLSCTRSERTLGRSSKC